MINEISNFIKRNKIILGVIALAVYFIGAFVSVKDVQVPIVTSSILGTIGGINLTLGILIVIVGIVCVFIPGAQPFALALIGGGIFLAKASFVVAIAGVIETFIKNPIVIISFGLIFAFFIFRKRK